MARAARSREWWSKTVSRWRRSGLTAREFAACEDLSPSTLTWWSSMSTRDTRASHGPSPSEAIEPIEMDRAASVGFVEVAVSGAVVRCEVGTRVEYVASLVRALRGGCSC
jgi:hypothetical protein